MSIDCIFSFIKCTTSRLSAALVVISHHMMLYFSILDAAAAAAECNSVTSCFQLFNLS